MNDATPAAGDGPRQTIEGGISVPPFVFGKWLNQWLEVGNWVGNASGGKNKRA
jgi:hypothetical protein